LFRAKQRFADRARVVQRSSTVLGHEWLRSIASRKDVCDLSIFHLPTKPGYGVTAAFSDGTDVPYAALTGAATAADAEAQFYDKEPQRLFFSVHFPIVITEAPLFTCELDPKNNTPISKEVDHAVLAWRNPVYRLPHCIAHIVQAKAADAFAKKVSSDFQFLLENTESELEAIAKIPSFSRLMTPNLQTKIRKEGKTLNSPRFAASFLSAGTSHVPPACPVVARTRHAEGQPAGPLPRAIQTSPTPSRGSMSTRPNRITWPIILESCWPSARRLSRRES
jgi:hypothetical protein